MSSEQRCLGMRSAGTCRVCWNAALSNVGTAATAWISGADMEALGCSALRSSSIHGRERAPVCQAAARLGAVRFGGVPVLRP